MDDRRARPTPARRPSTATTRAQRSRRAAERERRRRFRRRRLIVVGALVVIVAGGAWLVVRPDDGGRDFTQVAVRPSTTTTTLAPTTTTSTTLAPTTTTTIEPGTLPQTMDKPRVDSAAFQARVQGLWQAIVTGDPAPAMPFFFPLSAYQQVKAISDPTGDWNSRLVASYRSDLAALRAQLGANASRATLVGLEVPESQATWVLPGAEYNKGSYWRVYGSVLRYSVDGRTATFPVASLISWRGEWYVVHLRAVPSE